MKASRNKTIDISVEEGACYLNRCISVTKPSTVEEILDKTINGDTFDVFPKLPKKFVDLLIVDPPYNLDKDFNGQKFKKMTDDLYEEYTTAGQKNKKFIFIAAFQVPYSVYDRRVLSAKTHNYI